MTGTMSSNALRRPQVRTVAIAPDDLEVTGYRWLSGRAVPYGEWSDIGGYMEQHLAGSFTRSIQTAAIALPLMLQHQGDVMPIGKVHQWRENDQGLDAVWELDQADPVAREAARKAANGYLSGLSIGFQSVRAKQDTDANGTLWITRQESRLLEVSLVSTPAFAGAAVHAVRSRQTHPASAEVEWWWDWLERNRRQSQYGRAEIEAWWDWLEHNRRPPRPPT